MISLRVHKLWAPMMILVDVVSADPSAWHQNLGRLDLVFRLLLAVHT